jgi:hypothetical protein
VTDAIELKRQLKSIIQSRHGEHNAMTAGDMAQALGFRSVSGGDREVRAMILELIWSEDLAVLATTGKKPGFFTPETWAEWERYKTQMDNRIKGDVMRRDKLDQNVHALFEGTVRVKML